MLTISLIYVIMLLGFKLINPIYINRINILISLYSGGLVLSVLMNYGITEGSSGLYNSLGFISSILIMGQLLIWIITILLLLLGESGKTRKNILRSSEYTLILLISVFGMNFLIISNDLVTMSLAVELISLPFYISASLYKNGEECNALGLNKNNLSGIFAGLKYLLLGSIASCFILFGSAIIYGETGLTNVTKITELLNVENTWDSIKNINNYSFEYNIFLIGSAFMIAGYLIKLGSAPFHNWGPDVYDGVPTMVTSWISILPKLSFLIFFSIFFKTLFNSTLSSLILFSSFFSLVLGSIMGLLIFRIKRLLAYSSIAHLGFILLGIALINYINYTPIFFYIVVYGLTSINIFFILNSLNLRSNIELLSQLKGLAYHNKLLSFSLAISFFSLAGIPPFIGFYSKTLILIESIYLDSYFLTLIALITSVISTIYYLRVIKIMNFDIPSNAPTELLLFQININETISSTIAFLTLIILSFLFYGDFLILASSSNVFI